MHDAAKRLELAGVADPRNDARRLMAAAIGCKSAGLIARSKDIADAKAAETFAVYIAARCDRKPVSQILGFREFFGRRFSVNSDVLDPRPDTETLIEHALAAPFETVLDLGTGSGAILVTLLAERQSATGVGTDISTDAIRIARKNGAALGVADRAAFLASDWWSDVDGRFDLIVSNPPYISADEMVGLQAEVTKWEPHGALTDGADGLTAYRKIAAGLLAHLTSGGQVLVEIGPTQALAVTQIFREAGLRELTVHKDLDGRDRVVSGLA